MTHIEDAHSILTEAINDVGYWRWWTSDLPQSFQVEFGGVQLRTPGPDGSSQSVEPLALRFTDVATVAFLTRNTAAAPPDWPRQLAAAAIEPFGLSHDQFTLSDDRQIHAIVAEAQHVEPFFGQDPRRADWKTCSAKLAFWAGPVGLSVGAKTFSLVGFNGPIALEDVSAMNEAWWAYWRDYWKQRGGPNSLPTDYACEVVIPIER